MIRVIKELNKIKKDYPNLYEQIKKDNQESSLFQISNNCIDNHCPNYGNIEFDNIKWHLCNDNWSGFNDGWVFNYFEILDLCFDEKLKKK